MPLPDTFTLNHFVDTHREEFVKYELWVSEELTQHLIEAHNLDPAFTTVIVDMDEEEPVGKSVDGVVLVRLNGRFYIPQKDKQGVDLEMTPEDWYESAAEWFEENGVEVTLDEDSDELIKFTSFVGAVELPEPEAAAEEPEGDEPADESGEGAEEEPAEEVGDEAEPVEEDLDSGDEDLKEFEDALGL